MTNTANVSKNYLADITGELDYPDIDKLVKEVGLKNLLPESASKYVDELSDYEDKGVHSYLCNIDKSPTSCNTAKLIAKREAGRFVGWVQWDLKAPKRLLYSNNGTLLDIALPKSNSVALPPNRKQAGKGLKGNNLRATVVGQGATNKPKGTHYQRSVKPDRKGDDRQLFKDAVEGKGNLSIGDRAVLFNSDGSITTGVNNIRDNAVANERSSNIPSESANNGSIPSEIRKAKPYKTSNHPNRSRIAKTNDLAGGIAALGGISALVGVISLLLPMHFITSAITFLTSITTFFTNVNNAANTYLTVVDALLGLFNIKNSTKALKTFIQEIADNAIGKENVQEVKNAFGKGINTIAVTTKLLEKTESLIAGANNKTDEVAIRVGTLNNALGEAGLIPPELMATSIATDEFVEKRIKDSEDLGENITQLTSEIKDKKETTELLKNEQEARDKIKAKQAKDVSDLTGLLDVAKTDVSKLDTSKL
jgi:hypothetical protein